jgi:hypothetical protein
MKKTFALLMITTAIVFSFAAFYLQSSNDYEFAGFPMTESGPDCTCVSGGWDIQFASPPCVTEGLAKWCLSHMQNFHPSIF